ncbi:YebC/PmpR family DNA-binding transcriptional regulator [Salipaludibacillus sp. LMS25]|jgi:YebC/PmpR family DNA-binding regulatory protein|uniref:YebC/PmpR family DNA-binding transcriptional regulator n=1 Tax=Salipaludibacillus sp. LMS25 TaxID=2924031 RepID=UPI0020D0F140|nr:YebC/PmpR family DNA-binding transcriptional regulator [Salipaludibacillus sp. LMS25]UTR14240.1 YebC/PmpR family DNA-binding transcriptional regulator [Salipaludibacillus sp. LMS25]
MAGHSKWSNIKHRKGRQDAKKGKVFTKLSKEIFQAVRESGGDPVTNTTLRLAIEKAKQANMPNDNIERTINKALGNIEGVIYEDIIYEGYAPHGVAVYVQALTDNKNRTAAEVRLAFNKNNGNLGESGCVAFMFARKGYLLFEKTEKLDEDIVLLEAIEAGAEDVKNEADALEVITAPEDFEQVKQCLPNAINAEPIVAEVTMLPSTTTLVNDEQALAIIQLIEALEDNDDVQNVYHNLEIAD